MRSLSLLLSASFFWVACVTPQHDDWQVFHPPAEPSPTGEPLEPAECRSFDLTEAPDAEADSTPAAVEAATLLNRILRQEPVTLVDQEYLQSLLDQSAPLDTPIAKAVVSAAMLQEYVKYFDNSQFIDDSEASAWRVSNMIDIRNLDATLAKYDLNLGREFQTNIFFQNRFFTEIVSTLADTHHLHSRAVVEALRVINQENETAAAKSSSLWAKVAPQEDNTISMPVAEALNLDQFAQKSRDELFEAVDDLAGRQEFRQAVKILNTVESDDLYYSTAREKIRAVSNQAVELLRSKAAEMFEQARRLPLGEIRLNHLVEAREILQQAVQDFPDSDKIFTANANIKIIDRYIEEAKSTTPETSISGESGQASNPEQAPTVGSL